MIDVRNSNLQKAFKRLEEYGENLRYDRLLRNFI